MITVLLVTNHQSLAEYTPYFVGLLYALNITFETPLSGMSTNPARTFGTRCLRALLAYSLDLFCRANHGHAGRRGSFSSGAPR